MVKTLYRAIGHFYDFWSNLEHISDNREIVEAFYLMFGGDYTEIWLH